MTSEKVQVGDDCNGLVISDMGGFREVHGGGVWDWVNK